MPEHVHILLSEPDQETLADAIHFLKLSFAQTPEIDGPEIGVTGIDDPEIDGAPGSGPFCGP